MIREVLQRDGDQPPMRRYLHHLRDTLILLGADKAKGVPLRKLID